MSRGTSDLHWLLEHELLAAARYRRFVSLVMVGPDGEDQHDWHMLEGNVRESDELFDMGSYSAIVMTETDLHGSQIAIDRFAGLCNGHDGLVFAAGSFPGDGQHAPELVTAVYRRLKYQRAKTGKKNGSAEEPTGDG